MFGGHSRLLAKGARAEGVIVKAHAVQGQMTVDPGYEIVVRAKLADGSTTEFTEGRMIGCLFPQEHGSVYVGRVVPVRYDESDHSKITVDRPAIEAAQKQADTAQQAQLNAQVANLGQAGAPGLGGGGDLQAQLLAAAGMNSGSVIDLRSAAPGGSAPDPVARLEKLAALKQQGLLTDAEFEAAKAKVLGES
jgi:hypothetical protein